MPIVLGNLRTYRDEGFRVQFPIHPEPNGLLPFGTTKDSNYFLWLCKGEPKQWPVVIWDTRYLHCKSFSRKGFVGFLLDLLTQKDSLFSNKEFPFPCEVFGEPRRFARSCDFR